jgi:hypothetical protein
LQSVRLSGEVAHDLDKCVPLRAWECRMWPRCVAQLWPDWRRLLGVVAGVQAPGRRVPFARSVRGWRRPARIGWSPLARQVPGPHDLVPNLNAECAVGLRISEDVRVAGLGRYAVSSWAIGRTRGRHLAVGRRRLPVEGHERSLRSPPEQPRNVPDQRKHGAGARAAVWSPPGEDLVGEGDSSRWTVVCDCRTKCSLTCHRPREARPRRAKFGSALTARHASTGATRLRTRSALRRRVRPFRTRRPARPSCGTGTTVADRLTVR